MYNRKYMEDKDVNYHILKMSNIYTLNLSLSNMGNILIYDFIKFIIVDNW